MQARRTIISSAFLAVAGLCAAQLPGPVPGGQVPATGPSVATTPPADPSAGRRPVALHWGDFDADELQDALAILPEGRLSLLRNTGGGSFEDVTVAAGLDAVQAASFAVWGDYDGDGLVDVFVGTHGGPSHLLRNVGGFFVDVTAEAGITGASADRAAHWMDVDGDARLDLHLVSAEANTIYRAIGNGAFEPIPLPTLADSRGDHRVPGLASEVRPGEGGEIVITRSAADGVRSLAGAVGGPPLTSELVVGPASTTVSPTGSALTAGTASPVSCVASLDDPFGASCIQASETATLGMLYPLSDKFFIEEATGRVGIGTTTPNAELSIHNVGSVDGAKMLSFGEGDLSAFAFESGFTPTDGDNYMSVSTPFTGSAMTWKADGRVGIGTANPATELHVRDPNGNCQVQIDSAAGQYSTIRFNDGGIQQWVIGKHADNDFYLWDDSTAAEVLRVDQVTGNVGIGTTAPASSLHVAGSRTTLSPPTGVHLGTIGTGAGIEIAAAAGIANVDFSVGDQGDFGARMRYQSSGLLDIQGASEFAVDSNVLYVDADSNRVGIGTTSPEAQLDVNGFATINSLGIGIASPASSLHVAGNRTTISPPTGVHIGMASTGLGAGIELASSGGIANIDFSVGDEGDFGARLRYQSGGLLDIQGASEFAVDSNVLYVDADSNRVGIGTTSPDAKLDVAGVATIDSLGIGIASPGSSLHVAGGRGNLDPAPGVHLGTAGSSTGIEIAAAAGIANIDFSVGSEGDYGARMRYQSGGLLDIQGASEFAVDFNALYVDADSNRVGIGTASPTEPLTIEVAGTGRGLSHKNTWGVEMGSYADSTNGWFGTFTNHGLKFFVNDSSGDMILTSAGDLGIGTLSPAAKLDVNGTARVTVLTITGGADIVEGFDTSDDESLEPGTVVVIDPDAPGALMSSNEAYDRKVAGVVSGANGVHPGLHLGQESTMDGDTKVAMTGRVFVKCSTENGAIRPGDRLTTASLAGHAMKATDREHCDGAVLGKAMSSLDDGTGLVLVLVNLQ